MLQLLLLQSRKAIRSEITVAFKRGVTVAVKRPQPPESSFQKAAATFSTFYILQHFHFSNFTFPPILPLLCYLWNVITVQTGVIGPYLTIVQMLVVTDKKIKGRTAPWVTTPTPCCNSDWCNFAIMSAQQSMGAEYLYNFLRTFFESTFKIKAHKQCSRRCIIWWPSP